MLVESQNEADLGFRLSQSLSLKCRKRGHFCHLGKASQWPLVVAYWIGGPVAHKSILGVLCIPVMFLALNKKWLCMKLQKLKGQEIHH